MEDTSVRVVQHLCRFTAGLWEIHPFSEGNTRTTAVFLIQYLRSMGFDVNNELKNRYMVICPPEELSSPDKLPDVSKDAFYAKVEKAISEVKAGQTHSMKPNESLDDFLDRMEAEGNV